MYGKSAEVWLGRSETLAYLDALVAEMNKPKGQAPKKMTDLVRQENGSTLVHITVAIALARWCDPAYAAWCDHALTLDPRALVVAPSKAEETLNPRAQMAEALASGKFASSIYQARARASARDTLPLSNDARVRVLDLQRGKAAMEGTRGK